jgi:hypothetical protein
MEVTVDRYGRRVKLPGQMWIDRQDEWYNLTLFDPERPAILGMYDYAGPPQPLTGAPIRSWAGPFQKQFQVFGSKPTAGFHEVPLRESLVTRTRPVQPAADTKSSYKTLNTFLKAKYTVLGS